MEYREKIVKAVQNGKGDKRRLAWSQDFADKFDKIFNKERKHVSRDTNTKSKGAMPKGE